MNRSIIIITFFITIFLAACSGDVSPQAASPTPQVKDLLESQATEQNIPTLELPEQSAITLTSENSVPTVSPTPDITPTASQTPWVPMPKYGSESHHPEKDNVLSLLSDAGAQIVRFNGVRWSIVEPQEGQFDWSTLQTLDIALQELAEREIDVILIVRSAPAWAQKVQGSVCGPITQDKFGAFANFMTMLVNRYSVPPYNVKYWELGNEPDVAPELVGADSVFGCWGDSQDPYYGGGYYAEMLKAVYPAIKSVDPDAQVLIGGLLLDCDPYHPPEGNDCLPSQFFSGILANQGAEYFDIVSFHGYPPFRKSKIWDKDFPSWNERGGVVVGKIDYIRDLMEQYSVEKPLFLTESSLICPEWNISDCNPPNENFFETQADYVIRLFIRNWSMDIAGTIWYQFEDQGWRYGGLVGDDPSNPKPAFRAFQFINDKLAGFYYIGEAPFHSGVPGYKFSNTEHETWVLWSLDESPKSIELPQNVLMVYDKYGQPITTQGIELTVSSPVYIDVEP